MRMQIKHWAACVCIGLGALVVATAVSAQATDPLVGTWKLDVAKSTYKPGPAPKSATVVVEPAGKGIKIAVDAVTGDGSPLKWGFTTQRDGKDAPVTGNPMYDTANSTQASPGSGTTVYKKDGKVIVTSKVEVSKDGKMLTITSTGTDPKGQAINNVAHYVKQ
jgi:hypothetical protein